MENILENVETSVTLILLIAVVVLILRMAIKIIPEYERGVLFRLGRLVSVKGAGTDHYYSCC